MNLSQRDEHLRELMDDPDCDPKRLDATLRRFGLVNRLVAGWDTVYRARLRSLLASLGRPAKVLDIGSGGGDVVTHLARRAHRDGFEVEWTGVDPDPRAHVAALKRASSSAATSPTIRFVCADAQVLLDRGETFDVVISNHVLHHLDAAELQEFTEASLQLATTSVLHSDIARSRLAYGLFSVGIIPLAPGTFLRTDGLRSIRRSYQREELAAALGSRWRVSSPAAFRLVAEGAGRG